MPWKHQQRLHRVLQKGIRAWNGLYGVSFTKLQNNDSFVMLPVGFSTVYDFSQACSFLIMVRKDEICISRQLCVFYWSMFVSTVWFSSLCGNAQKYIWGTDLLSSWKSKGGEGSGILWGFLFPSWNHRSQRFCKMTKLCFIVRLLDFSCMCCRWT